MDIDDLRTRARVLRALVQPLSNAPWGLRCESLDRVFDLLDQLPEPARGCQ